MIVFHQNSSSPESIERHLKNCEGPFLDALRARVDLASYAAKLASLAERFEATENGELVGLIAAYCNDPSFQNAFVSNVSVLTPWRGQGVAKTLLAATIARASDLGFAAVQLEVEHENIKAIKLYESLGFTQTESDSFRRKMRLEIAR